MNPSIDPQQRQHVTHEAVESGVTPSPRHNFSESVWKLCSPCSVCETVCAGGQRSTSCSVHTDIPAQKTRFSAEPRGKTRLIRGEFESRESRQKTSLTSSC